jgi:hypothetical protein
MYRETACFTYWLSNETVPAVIKRLLRADRARHATLFGESAVTFEENELVEILGSMGLPFEKLVILNYGILDQ